MRKISENEMVILKKIKLQKGLWLGIFLMIGIITGAMTENIGICLPLGICFGVVIELILNKY
jgi:urea transporter